MTRSLWLIDQQQSSPSLFISFNFNLSCFLHFLCPQELICPLRESLEGSQELTKQGTWLIWKFSFPPTSFQSSWIYIAESAAKM
ncbi:hypothetical protein QN277_028816 [Acacia crassicarpa]|uniref:Uncharacterized protein n=1 Tax=Acacia crassicarpa TaxID=499986 RepID=A0AAE1K1S9_9FABA|nr:hypothetical protein QN277_028816 [Acacia crassicarpa]